MKHRFVALLLLCALLGACFCSCGVLSELPFLSEDEDALAAPVSIFSPRECYVYQTLNVADKTLYDAVLSALLRCGKLSSLPAGVSDAERISPVLNAVLYDHPELFWVRGGGTIKRLGEQFLSYSFHYVQVEDLQATADRLMEEVRLCAEALPAEADEYDRALFAYQTVIEKTAYDDEAAAGITENTNAASALGVFLDGKAVCSGYAKAFQLLLSNLGVSCGFVTGTANGAPHAWNFVRLFGEHYFVDATFGEPPEDTDAVSPGPSYKTFCVTGEELSQTHTPDASYPLPECTATDCNYFVRNRLLWETLSEERLYELILAAAQAGEESVTVRFATEAAMQEAVERLFEGEQSVFDVLYRVRSRVGALRADSVQRSINGSVLTLYLKYQ